MENSVFASYSPDGSQIAMKHQLGNYKISKRYVKFDHKNGDIYESDESDGEFTLCERVDEKHKTD